MAAIVRCHHCRRPFTGTADRCPDCGTLSPVGMRGTVVKVGSIVGAIAALAITFSLVQKNRAIQGPSGQPVTHLAPLERADGEISFAEK